MEIKRELVEHLASLSRLKFTDEELENFKQEFAKTLEHVNELQKIDTKGVKLSLNTLNANNDLRLDEIGASLSQAEALQEAPEKAQGMFSIIKIVE